MDEPETRSRNGLLAGYLSEQELAAQLDRDPRTLLRWRKLRIGPPFIMVGVRPEYPIEGVRSWLAAGGTGGAIQSSADSRRRIQKQRTAAEVAA